MASGNSCRPRFSMKWPAWKCRLRKTLGQVSLAIGAVLVATSAPLTEARADYLPLSGAEVANNVAEIRVQNDGIHIQFEIYVGDAEKFAELIPDEWFETDVTDRPDKDERLVAFAETGLTARRADGTALPVRISRIEPLTRIDRTTALTGQRDPMTGREFPKPPDDPRVVFAELFYDFEDYRPDVIEIAPPTNPDGTPVATIGFVTFDRGVPVANFAYLSGPARLTIDWSDPWYSRFANPNLRRHHQSGLTTYLYVEPRELRHEILIRVRDLGDWLNLGLSSGQHLSSSDQQKLKSDASELLANRNPVLIDGKETAPARYRSELLTITTTGIQVVEDTIALNVDEAFLGVILSFPWRDLPETVSVHWEMFNDNITNVPTAAIDAAGPFLGGATPDDPIIVWRNHLLKYEDPVITPVSVAGAGRFPLPVLSLIASAIALGGGIIALRSRGGARMVAAATVVVSITGAVLLWDVAKVDVRNPMQRGPENADAEAAFAALLGNINTANLEGSREDRDTALAPLTTASSRSDVAAEVNRALALRVPGGGVARVTDVSELTLEELSPLEDGFGFSALAEWTVRAHAGHWGHTHRRLVEHRALVEIVEEDGNWKLDGLTVIEARLPDA